MFSFLGAECEGGDEIQQAEGAGEGEDSDPEQGPREAEGRTWRGTAQRLRAGWC